MATTDDRDVYCEPFVAMLKWVNRDLSAEDIPALAAAWLSEGRSSPALQVLAALEDPEWAECESAFREALAELDIEPLGQPDAAVALAKHYAREMLAGRLSPHGGARRIWSLCITLDFPNALMGFMAVAGRREELVAHRAEDPSTHDLLIAECDQQILDLARAFVGDADGEAADAD